MVNPLYCAEVSPLVGPKGLVNPPSTDTLADSAAFSCSTVFESQPPNSLCVHTLCSWASTGLAHASKPLDLACDLALQHFCD